MRDASPRHDVPGENEQRHREEREAVKTAEDRCGNCMQRNAQVEGREQDRGGQENQENRHSEREQQNWPADQKDQFRHRACSLGAAPLTACPFGWADSLQDQNTDLEEQPAGYEALGNPQGDVETKAALVECI